MSVEIYTYPNSIRTAKAAITALYNGVNISYPEFKMGVDNKSKDFLSWNPFGKVPTAMTKDGPLFESTAIMKYVASVGEDVGLNGKDEYEQASIDQWLCFVDGDLRLPGSAWINPILGYAAPNKEATAAAQEDIKKLLQGLNKYLQFRTYLVGDRVTLADIAMVCSLSTMYRLVLDTKFRKNFKNVNRYFELIANQKNVVAVLGEPVMCEKMAVAAEPKKEESSQSQEEAPKKEKKGKNPLDLLPESSFVLDDFKRLYQNKSNTRKDVLPTFWETFDAEGYSLYHIEYDDPAALEGQADFQVANLVNGFFQRLDRLRKYGFGIMLIFGEKKKHTLSGVWIFRGDGIPAEMSTCDDSELYIFKRLNPQDDADKELFSDYMAWDGNLGGRGEALDGKVFV